MYKTPLSKEEKELAEIARRRLREEERKGRIFDAKQRTIGVDVSALDHQVEEKKRMVETFKQKDEFFDQTQKQNVKIGTYLDSKRQEMRFFKNKEVDEYRKQNQRIEDRREYDLSDPLALKKDKPARIGDDDERCGVSSIQKFYGEDLNKKDRVKLQQEQLRTWVHEQTLEKQEREKLQKEEDMIFAQREKELNALAKQLELEKQKLRTLAIQSVKEFNLEQAKTRKEVDYLKNLKDEEEKLEELRTILNSDFLNEKFDTTIHATDPNRFIMYNFKGLRADQYEKIMEERYNQIIEKKKLLEEQLEREQAWALQQQIHLREAMKLEKEKQRIRKEKNIELRDTLKEQEKEFQDKMRRMNVEFNTNRVTEDFFAQFQTSSR